MADSITKDMTFGELIKKHPKAGRSCGLWPSLHRVPYSDR